MQTELFPFELALARAREALQEIEHRARFQGEVILGGVALQTSWMRRSVGQQIRRMREARHGR